MYENIPYEEAEEIKKKLRQKCSENLLDYFKFSNQSNLDKFLNTYKKYCSIYFNANIPENLNLYNDELLIGINNEIESMSKTDIPFRMLFEPLFRPMASIAYEGALQENDRLFNYGSRSINGDFSSSGLRFDKSNLALLDKLYNMDISYKFDCIKSGKYKAQETTYTFIRGLLDKCYFDAGENPKYTVTEVKLSDELLSANVYISNINSILKSNYEKELGKLDLTPVMDWQTEKINKIRNNFSSKKTIKKDFQELVSSMQIYYDDELTKKLKDLVSISDDEAYVDLMTILCDSQCYKVNENDIDELYIKTNKDLEHLFFILSKVRKRELYNYILARFGYEQVFKDLKKCAPDFKNRITEQISKSNRDIITADFPF